MAKVGVLIVTYNRLKLLQEEVDSIRQQTYTDFKIIVVDNCSSDDTAKWLDEQKDIYTIHIKPENIGPARAFSDGVKFIAEQGYEYCWLMDDDVECKPDALQYLMDGINMKPNIGFVCSKVVSPDGFPMNVPNIDTKLSANGYMDYADLLEYGILKVKDCTFVSMMFPCSLVYEVGLPLGDLYNWGVDTEFAERISLKYDSYSVNKSIVTHKRKIQKALLFEEEKDPVRLSYFKSQFRNSIFHAFKFNCKTGKEKVKFVLFYWVVTLKILSKLKFKQARIRISAFKDAMSFHPVIQYPEINKNEGTHSLD